MMKGLSPEAWRQPRVLYQSSSNVRITIYNALGNLVHLLVNSRYAPGQYDATWDASALRSGVYFYRLQTDTFVDTKKLVLLK